MNHATAHAAEIRGAATRLPRLRIARSFVFALMALAIVAAGALMMHGFVGGAAPAATLSVIGETFDKGF